MSLDQKHVPNPGAVDHLLHNLRRGIAHTAKEFDLTYAEVIGALHCVAMENWWECSQVREDDDE